MKHYIIVGGNFVNTGAEAMTFSTIDNLRKTNPNCKITMFSNLDANKDNSNYTFDVIHMSGSALRHAQNPRFDIKYYAMGIAHILLRKGNPFKEYKKLTELLKTCDGVFDISGFAISSQFKNRNTLGKLANVDLFAQYGIPYFFMPQSFGPFDYLENREGMLKRLKESLPKATKIFVREEEGYHMLVNLIGNKNVIKSYDMVLQTKTFNKSNIYKEVPSVKTIRIDTKNNVAIIPNMRNFDHGNKDEILSLYKTIMELLLNRGKNIYLISHSVEDIEACALIKNIFASEDKVHLLKEKIDSWNYSVLIREFDFAIASRFHSIVHSYRENVPCIALGWATKYKELLESVGQEEYIFDVRRLAGNKTDIVSAIRRMDERKHEECAVIKDKMFKIQETNCFSLLNL